MFFKLQVDILDFLVFVDEEDLTATVSKLFLISRKKSVFFFQKSLNFVISFVKV